MEAKAIAIIADLIATCGLPAAIRRIQRLDPERVSMEDLGSLARGSMADPDCHFSVDPSAFGDEEENLA